MILCICLGSIQAFEGKTKDPEKVRTHDGKLVSREKQKGEILVRALGNLKKTGPFYIKEGTGLKFFYWICGGHGNKGDFGGGPPVNLRVTRVVDGKRIVFSFKFKPLHLAKTKDFELLDGDIVKADERIF